MNTSDNTGTPKGVPTDPRPLGYWLRVVDGLLTSEFATAFEGEGIDRRDWMLLNAVSGEALHPSVAAKLARRSKRLHALAERGWVTETDGQWSLTDAGREAHTRLGSLVDGIRTRVSVAVSPDDFATTMTSLEAIARGLGWDENDRARRGSRPGRRFGRGFGPGRAHGRGFGHGRPGFGARDGDERCHPHHGQHGRHGAEQAYERGFDAGVAASARIAGPPA
ncbi:hypothetical protein QL996_12595 [Planococcus sp. APC 4015]|nr:hypothetical protein [Planococcus sp. APC 4015]